MIRKSEMKDLKAINENKKKGYDKMVKLIKATKDDIQTIWKMQVEAFTDLLEKYKDFETSPGAEKVEKIEWRFSFPATTFYFIVVEGEKVGVIRVVDHKDERPKKISPLFIMKEHRNKGYAQEAMKEAERIHGSDNWCLDTILQEEGNLHLYEKMGYRQTGRVEKINDRMDIVFYEKK